MCSLRHAHLVLVVLRQMWRFPLHMSTQWICAHQGCTWGMHPNWMAAYSVYMHFPVVARSWSSVHVIIVGIAVVVIGFLHGWCQHITFLVVCSCSVPVCILAFVVSCWMWLCRVGMCSQCNSLCVCSEALVWCHFFACHWRDTELGGVRCYVYTISCNAWRLFFFCDAVSTSVFNVASVPASIFHWHCTMLCLCMSLVHSVVHMLLLHV